MKQARTFVCEIDNHRAMLAAFITRQPVPFQAEVGPVVKHRTIPANRRLWKLHTKASEVCGYSPEECHEEMLCAHYGFKEVERKNPWTGEMERKKEPLQRSSTRNTKEFAAFMDFCENFYGSTLGVWLE